MRGPTKYLPVTSRRPGNAQTTSTSLRKPHKRVRRYFQFIETVWPLRCSEHLQTQPEGASSHAWIWLSYMFLLPCEFLEQNHPLECQRPICIISGCILIWGAVIYLFASLKDCGLLSSTGIANDCVAQCRAK